MDTSIFDDKNILPDDLMLQNALAATYPVWDTLRKYVISTCPNAIAEWNYPGVKYGWSFRIKDKKRAIVYLLPRQGYFKLAMVFGQKATDRILAGYVQQSIREDLMNARVYAEGRGIRIEIRDEALLEDIKFLVEVKLSN